MGPQVKGTHQSPPNTCQLFMRGLGVVLPLDPGAAVLVVEGGAQESQVLLPHMDQVEEVVFIASDTMEQPSPNTNLLILRVQAKR